MASSNKDNIIFESNARYNKSNVILDLTKDKLLFKKRRFLSSDYRITDRFDLDDIIEVNKVRYRINNRRQDITYYGFYKYNLVEDIEHKEQNDW